MLLWRAELGTSGRPRCAASAAADVCMSVGSVGVRAVQMDDAIWPSSAAAHFGSKLWSSRAQTPAARVVGFTSR